MPTPRHEQIDLSVTPYYHCMARCVRRAFLCGKDARTGVDFSHRKEWIRDRIRTLASMFAIDVCAYAVMSNHLHVVLRADQDRAEAFTEEEVIKRHTTLYPLSKERLPTSLPAKQRKTVIEMWRARLHNISWFMRALNEYIARKANKEDGVRGRFWEGRFKSQALVDERGLLTCMVYVDLNPIRAGLASSLEESDFTSIQERMTEHNKQSAAHSSRSAPRGMASFYNEGAEVGRAQGILPIAFVDYLKLVKWTGDLLGSDASAANDTSEPDAVRVLTERGITAHGWNEVQQSHSLESATALGEMEALEALASEGGKRTVRGIRIARLLVTRPTAST